MGHLSSCHFPTANIRDDILVRAFWKRCPAVVSAHGFQKVSVLLKALDTNKMITAYNCPIKYGGTLHLKTENANPFCHVADTLPIKIHSTYKYKDITITKTIIVGRDITVNSALTLSNDC